MSEQNAPIDPGTDNIAAPASPESQIAALQAEVAEARDPALRAVAETKNVRNACDAKWTTTASMPNGPLLNDLLPVIDNLGLGPGSRGKERRRRRFVDGREDGRTTARNRLGKASLHANRVKVGRSIRTFTPRFNSSRRRTIHPARSFSSPKKVTKYTNAYCDRRK